MADNFIGVNRGTRLGGELVYAANLLAQARDKVHDLSSTANNMNDGLIFSTIEAQFGLAAGKGAELVSLLTSVASKLDDAVILQFLAYIGGVTP